MKVKIEDLIVDVDFSNHSLKLGGVEISLSKDAEGQLRQMVMFNLGMFVPEEKKAIVKVKRSEFVNVKNKNMSKVMTDVWAKRKEERGGLGLCLYCDNKVVSGKKLCKGHLSKLGKARQNRKEK